MVELFDALEAADPVQRERALFAELARVLAQARDQQPLWRERLKDVVPGAIASREDLARLPILRKSDLLELQNRDQPFGGLNAIPAGGYARLFMSPGPIFEPGGRSQDWWGAARALFAAGIRSGHVVLNTFSYHLTPAGAMFESGAHALGCAIIPGRLTSLSSSPPLPNTDPMLTSVRQTCSKLCSTRRRKPVETRAQSGVPWYRAPPSRRRSRPSFARAGLPCVKPTGQPSSAS